MNLESSAIRLLDWLYDNSKKGEILSVDEFVEQKDGDSEKAYMLGKHLERNGWADVQFTLGPNTSASLTSDGVGRVERIRQIRGNRGARAADLQRQMLNWLYGQQEDRTPPQSWDGFVETGASHLLGRSFTADEVESQAKHLQGIRLIDANEIGEEEPGWINPRLTETGRDCVLRFNGEVGKYMDRTAEQQRGSQNYYGAVVQGDAHGAQFAWGNQQVTQNSGGNTVGANFQELATAIRSIVEGLPNYELPLEDAEEARVIAGEILAEVAKPEPNPSILRRARAAIIGFLTPIATGVSVGAGEGAQELARHTIENLSSAF